MGKFIVIILLIIMAGGLEQGASPERTEEITEFLMRWQNEMKNFTAQDVLYFVLDAGEKRELVLDVKYVPAVTRGAYSVSGGYKNKIKFTIKDSQNQELMTSEGKREELFHLKINTPGIYTLQFHNKNYFNLEFINFGVEILSEPLQKLKEEAQAKLYATDQAFASLLEWMYTLDSRLYEISGMQKFFESKNAQQLSQLETLRQRSVYAAFIETVIVLVLTFWQVFYIKSLLRPTISV